MYLNYFMYQLDSVEQIFDYCETIIEKVRTVDRNKLVTIVVDSVAASTKNELARITTKMDITDKLLSSRRR